MFPHLLASQASTARSSSSKIGLSVFIVSAALLAGCVAPQQQNVSEQSSVVTTEPEKPRHDYVKGMGYRFEWANATNALFTAPAEVKAQALEICMETGFTTTYMSSLSFDDGITTGYFNCRGSGGN